jgi:hypothetical protein
MGDAPPRGNRQQLGSETHAEDRDLALERGRHQRHLGGQERVLGATDGTLAPAKRHHRADVVDRRQRLRVTAVRVALDHLTAGGAQAVGDEANLPIGQVGDDQGRLHEAAA